MPNHNAAPYIPTSELSQAVYDYYDGALRTEPGFMADYIAAAWRGLTPEQRLELETFHALLYPHDLAEQQLAARRSLLAPHIEIQATNLAQLEGGLAA